MWEKEGTVQFLSFCLDGRRFGIHLGRVRRVLRAVDPTPLPSAPASVLGVIDLQGTIVPVLDIRGKFGFPRREIGLEDQLIVAETGARTVALLVDNSLEVIERNAKEIAATKDVCEPCEAISGVIRLEPALLLIHDLDRFLSAGEERTLASAITRQQAHGN